MTSTIKKFPDSDIPYGLVRKNPPAPAERTLEEQAAYLEGVEVAKTAIIPLLATRSMDPTLAQACAAIDAAADRFQAYSSDSVLAERTAEKQAAYEAVEAAKEAVRRYEMFPNKIPSLRGMPSYTVEQICKAIDAACLPEPEPEIEVTEAMINAAFRAESESPVAAFDDLESRKEICTVMFRAMERQRRKDET